MINSKQIGAALLIAGTSIGAGMLALPIATASNGFLPSTALLLLSWVIMLFSAFAMLEVTLHIGHKANLVSMAQKTIGPLGQYSSWALYLLLLYALNAAYLSGLRELIQNLLHTHFNIHIASSITILFLALIASLLLKGTTRSDRINRLFMLGLIISYLLLSANLLPHASIGYLKQANWQNLPLSIPVIITAFGYQIIIPSLCQYLDYDRKKIYQALLLGSAFPLVIYLFVAVFYYDCNRWGGFI